MILLQEQKGYMEYNIPQTNEIFIIPYISISIPAILFFKMAAMEDNPDFFIFLD